MWGYLVILQLSFMFLCFTDCLCGCVFFSGILLIYSAVYLPVCLVKLLGQPALADTSSKELEGFVGAKLLTLQTATIAFGLGRRRWSSPQNSAIYTVSVPQHHTITAGLPLIKCRLFFWVDLDKLVSRLSPSLPAVA